MSKGLAIAIIAVVGLMAVGVITGVSISGRAVASTSPDFEDYNFQKQCIPSYTLASEGPADGNHYSVAYGIDCELVYIRYADQAESDLVDCATDVIAPDELCIFYK